MTLLIGAICSVLVACASSTRVTETGSPGVYAVSTSATGGRLAWVRAHERAIEAARAYCEQRGMQPDVHLEMMRGFELLEAHDSVLKFGCHPTL